MTAASLKKLLDEKAALFNRPAFIAEDPVSIPHRFTRPRDIEIMAFMAAIFAWGQRKTIINKCLDLAKRMDDSPADFVAGGSERELRRLEGFVHRTFNDTDLLYFISFFRHWYQHHHSLEEAFTLHRARIAEPMESMLNGFRTVFFAHAEAPQRTLRHIASPAQGSACKRINMFLRWMVRHDNRGVDFGLWKKIKPSELICPLDVHVHRVALSVGLMQRTIPDWKAACELTAALRKLDPTDPVRYDFALFGMGVMEGRKQ
jgi:uncharacterized protein (TIGR02757 family)